MKILKMISSTLVLLLVLSGCSSTQKISRKAAYPEMYTKADGNDSDYASD